jgi:hypothetical protein
MSACEVRCLVDDLLRREIVARFLEGDRIEWIAKGVSRTFEPSHVEAALRVALRRRRAR